tara:strand:+ start:1057 stop:1635 length:579 start_codon:yes stop_codon:yes gene_type:complete
MPKVRVSYTDSEKSLKLKVVDNNEVVSSFTLKAKKSFDGNIIIYDHADVDIVLMPEQKKIVTFKKDDVNGDIAYGAATRLFSELSRLGIIDRNTIQGGSTLDSYESTILDNELKSPIKLVLLAISKWIESERPYFEYGQDYEDLAADRMTDPSDEESTELGEVPQDKQKGSIVPGYYRSPYWMSYILENKEE